MSVCVSVCVAQIPEVYQVHIGDEVLSGQLCLSAPVYFCGCVYLFVRVCVYLRGSELCLPSWREIWLMGRKCTEMD